jgi:syntaxin-binding protein 5
MSTSKMKRFVSIKGVIDNLRQSVNSPSPPGGATGGAGGGPAGGVPVRLEQDIIESLVSEQFTSEFTNRHGFPHKPTALAFDPLQKIMAIGNRLGAVRLYGKPGVDIEFRHKSESAVFQLIFVVNTGHLLTACTDNTINLWDYKKKTPELIQTLKMMAREKVTEICLEFQDHWLYIGTDKGNVHILNMESFALSGYKIDWNKLMDPFQKNQPGNKNRCSITS